MISSWYCNNSPQSLS